MLLCNICNMNAMRGPITGWMDGDDVLGVMKDLLPFGWMLMMYWGIIKDLLPFGWMVMMYWGLMKDLLPFGWMVMMCRWLMKDLLPFGWMVMMYWGLMKKLGHSSQPPAFTPDFQRPFTHRWYSES